LDDRALNTAMGGSSSRYFPDFPESIFHVDPHAGNLMAQTQKHPSFTFLLPDWGRDRRLSARLHYAHRSRLILREGRNVVHMQKTS
jgi:predicted unusual protein kinase regulating ubiquinone biosynthesis (AarF/ABC1/UbiB family)